MFSHRKSPFNGKKLRLGKVYLFSIFWGGAKQKVDRDGPTLCKRCKCESELFVVDDGHRPSSHRAGRDGQGRVHAGDDRIRGDVLVIAVRFMVIEDALAVRIIHVDVLLSFASFFLRHPHYRRGQKRFNPESDFRKRLQFWTQKNIDAIGLFSFD